MKILTFLFTLIPALVAAQTPTYIFTATDPSGFVDDDSKLRAETIDTARRQLAKSKLVTLVDTREAATVVVEVIGTTQQESIDYMGVLANAISSPLVQHRSDEKQTITVRHATLTVGSYSTDLKATGVGKHSELGRIVERWVKENAKQLQVAR
jgi:hypothetical protein